MIEIRNVTKSFDDTIASNNLSLDLDEGIIGLVGENGAGKSTLFRLISNIIYQDKGEIIVDGFKNSSKEAKSLIFFLPDDPFIKNYYTISNILSFYSAFYPLDKDKFNSLVEAFSLPTDRKILGFSKGMRRKLFIAIALSINCKYILLDEAFDGMDPIVMNRIKEEILNLKEEGKTIVIASHNINTLEQLADRIVFLYKGSLAKDGLVEDMATEMIKYQVAVRNNLTIESLSSLNAEIISLKKVGSIYHIVIKSSKDFKDKFIKEYKPLIFEEIPLDPEEIVMLNMIISRKEK